MTNKEDSEKKNHYIEPCFLKMGLDVSAKNIDPGKPALIAQADLSVSAFCQFTLLHYGSSLFTSVVGSESSPSSRDILVTRP